MPEISTVITRDKAADMLNTHRDTVTSAGKVPGEGKPF
jgi:hypothetical protein